MAPKSFRNFNKLPPELRIMIWKLATKEPRLIRATQLLRSRLYLPHPQSLYHLQTTYPTPAILHVSSESRQEALKHYTLVNANLRCHPYFAVPFFAKVYINFTIDTVYFTNFFSTPEFLFALVELSSFARGSPSKGLPNLAIRSILLPQIVMHSPSLQFIQPPNAPPRRQRLPSALSLAVMAHPSITEIKVMLDQSNFVRAPLEELKKFRLVERNNEQRYANGKLKPVTARVPTYYIENSFGGGQWGRKYLGEDEDEKRWDVWVQGGGMKPNFSFWQVKKGR
ncbi:hypothetical protein BGZ60DRAFT_554822 [Tricladium varicosporioides]|nr:hypothetical protein BGZ60DRAFT_554822 [Hymenoscyphus varicosporioides]